MIITRSPLRISLGGGGTDLASYYEQHGGFLIAAALDKYVYITLHRTFDPDMIIKYSRFERVPHVDAIEHPIIREALRLTGATGGHLELTSMSDIPAGTGLGSSGSFTTALLHALHMQQKRIVSKQELAEEACRIEIDILGEPIGKQDQYIAAFGGVTCFTFNPGGKVDVAPLAASEETLVNLEDNLLLFFTGYTRSASAILKDQNDRTKSSDGAMVRNLHRVKEIGVASCEALEHGDLHGFAALMHEHWELKRKRSGGMSNSRIDDCYELARRNGALGGKVIGAGGGGFLMFYAEDKGRLRHAMREAGLAEVRLRFDFYGTQVVTQS
ncbi:MAG: bifunctional fucokinase/L-fucose-P-guanylyltransferase [Candidatus Eremiobacteraeota bacterium]|nr:bifunctional fucokinase/L-fucose-P-guanylyltransferase [Candidatus Eremiobacteraeota bacterium]